MTQLGKTWEHPHDNRKNMCHISIFSKLANHAVFPQSGHSRQEERPFFIIFPHFSKKRTLMKICTAYRCPIHQIKADEIVLQMQKESFCFDKYV